MYSNSVITEAMRSTLKQSTHVIDYNGNSDSDSDYNIKFVDIDLLCNKLNIQLLANDFITHIKKRHKIEIKNQADKLLKSKVTWKKKIPAKQIRKKSLKVSIPISGLISKPPLNI